MITISLKTAHGEITARIDQNNRLLASILEDIKELVPEYITAIGQALPSSSSTSERRHPKREDARPHDQ